MYALLRRMGWLKENHRLLCSNCNRAREVYGDQIAKELGSRKKELWVVLRDLLSESTSEKP
jgi:5-methylcytosine-specific restriction endonuclease McrA